MYRRRVTNCRPWMALPTERAAMAMRPSSTSARLLGARGGTTVCCPGVAPPGARVPIHASPVPTHHRHSRPGSATTSPGVMSKRVREEHEGTDRAVAISAPQHRPNDSFLPEQSQVLVPVLPTVSVHDNLMMPHPQYLAKLFVHAAQPKATRRMLVMQES